MSSEKISKIINFYREFLIINWFNLIKHLDFIDYERREDVINHFLQSNWENLVETSLFNNRNTFLRHYGEGADSEPYDRIYCHEEIPKYEVCCFSNKGKILDYSDNTFINCNNMLFDSFNDKHLKDKKPFETVIVYDAEDEVHTFCIDDIIFNIREFNFFIKNKERRDINVNNIN